MTAYTHLQTPLGPLLLTACDEKLTGLSFADRPHAPRIAPGWLEQEDHPLFAQTRLQLEQVASGQRRSFDLPIHLHGTPFQLRIWHEIAAIPYGHTRTYGEIARRLGSPGSDRAVGAATGRNPLCWVVPCHRVLGQNGALTGYAGGLPRKTALLALESGHTPTLLPPLSASDTPPHSSQAACALLP